MPGPTEYNGKVAGVGSPFECDVKDDGAEGKLRSCYHRGNVEFKTDDNVTYIVITKGNGEESDPIIIGKNGADVKI